MRKLTLVQFEYGRVPIGAIYLASGLEKEGVDFEIKVYPAREPSLRGLQALFAASGDILAVGSMIDMLPYVIVALKRVKEDFPEKTIILGGHGPMAAAEDLLHRFEFIDFIIKADGVVSLPKLVRGIIEGRNMLDDVDGLVYRKKGKILGNKYSPYPHFSFLPAYHRIDIKPYSLFPIRTSSGCPYRCSFCSYPYLIKEKIVYRDMEKVIAEIKLIKELTQGRKISIDIVDEGFMVNKKRVLEFCALLKKDKLNISWSCFGRVDRADEELLKSMSSSGCRSIFFGVESGSERILRKTRKGFAVSDAIKILLCAKNYIKEIMASFIFGFPFETYNDFIDTVGVIKYLQAKKIRTQLSPLSPVRGSPIYSQYRKNLKFSPHAPCAITRLNSLPQESLDLIRNNPEIFYEYFYFAYKDLSRIMKLQATLKI